MSPAPSPQSIELGRVVDRGIRESGCIDMEALCIVPGEKVWGVMIDIHVLSDGGNIFDACGLAAIAALRTAVVPAERFDVGEDHVLAVKGTPVMASFSASVDASSTTPAKTRRPAARSGSHHPR